MPLLAKSLIRTALYVLGAISAVAVAGGLYVHWSGATIGLSGSGRGLVLEHVDSESRMEDLEADRRLDSVSLARAEGDASQAAAPVMARPAAASPPDDASATANYWTEYRGPGRAGIYDQSPIRTDWPPDGPQELWREQIGGGYASMVVADGLLFTIEQRRDREVVAAYRIEDGRQAWEHSWKSSIL